MLAQGGRVTRIESGHAWVRVGPQSGCPACDAGEGCGAGLFGRLLQRSPVDIRLPATPGLQAGQSVSVGIPETRYLSLVWRLYGLPLLAALLAGAAGWALVPDAGPGVRDGVTALAALGAGLLVLKLSRRSTGRLVQGMALSLLPEERPVAACARNTDSNEPAP